MDNPVMISPSSVTYTGTSASINANGGVDFNACSVLSVNDIFSADYTVYQIFINVTATSGAGAINCQLRTGGSDVGTGTYTRQTYQGDGTTFSGSRSSSQASWAIAYMYSGAGNLDSVLAKITFWRPFDTDKTLYSSHQVSGYLEAYHWVNAGSQSDSTSFDGLTFLMGANMTGYLTVAGFGE